MRMLNGVLAHNTDALVHTQTPCTSFPPRHHAIQSYARRGLFRYVLSILTVTLRLLTALTFPSPSWPTCTPMCTLDAHPCAFALAGCPHRRVGARALSFTHTLGARVHAGGMRACWGHACTLGAHTHVGRTCTLWAHAHVCWRCYRPLDPGTSPRRSTGISAARTTPWSWMTPSNGKIELVVLVYASPDVDGLHESPGDSAPMYVTRSPVSSCPAPCAPVLLPCTLCSISTTL
jgi:hypothetical protein